MQLSKTKQYCGTKETKYQVKNINTTQKILTHFTSDIIETECSRVFWEKHFNHFSLFQGNSSAMEGKG